MNRTESQVPPTTQFKVLVADDEPISQAAVATTLESFGYEVIEATNGLEAWEILQKNEAPLLVIMDWTMPDMDGVEVCRKVRSLDTLQPPYIIILTARDTQEDVLVALNAGADEFLAKPVDPLELKARLEVGKRMVSLQKKLTENIAQLKKALEDVNTLQGILPICCYCKKIRNDQQYWQQVEHYIAENTNAEFSHGICPDCWERYIRPEMEQVKKQDGMQSG